VRRERRTTDEEVLRARSEPSQTDLLARNALETDGRAELLKVLDQDNPPRVIRCGSSGCSNASADEVGKRLSRT
jgi:hypothetical protein